MRNIAPETGRHLVEVALGWRKQETMEVVDRARGKVIGDSDKPFHHHAVFARELGGRHRWSERMIRRFDTGYTNES